MITAGTGPHAGQPVETRGAPLGQGRAVMIMIHGRNAAPRNILELVAALEHPAFTYLAPAARGNAWYPHSFLAPIEVNEPGITSGISVVHGLVAAANEAGVPDERVVLLGFSQRACLTVTAAHRRPSRYGGVVVYSGGLIGPPGTRWPAEGDFGGTPVLLGCSDVDAHVPAARMDETAQVLTAMNADVSARIYPGMGHLVNEDEIAWTLDVMARVAG